MCVIFAKPSSSQYKYFDSAGCTVSRRLVSPSPTPLTLLFYFLPVLKSDGVHPADHPGLSQPQRNTQRIRSYSSKLLGLVTYQPICDHQCRTYRSEDRRVGKERHTQ